MRAFCRKTATPGQLLEWKSKTITQHIPRRETDNKTFTRTQLVTNQTSVLLHTEEQLEITTLTALLNIYFQSTDWICCNLNTD